MLVVEDDEESHLEGFARNLLSLLQQPEATSIAGLVIGRFQRASGVSRQRLAQLIADIPQLHGVPVVANVDVGHTNPLFTFPIGGAARLVGDPEDTHLVLTRH
ncbi:MAG: microcin C7 resistance protein MccF-like protein [Actinomycetota bacterium]|nr:microcin C7 resistance protein MccF-like protein [Actinomycetota bacterium]